VKNEKDMVLLLTFDLEEFDLKENRNQLTMDEKLNVTRQGLMNALRILKKYKVKSTFFTTSLFAQAFPRIIRRISRFHEIALHGRRDTDEYGTMGSASAYSILGRSKKSIEGIIGDNVYGFRAPRFHPPDYRTLKALGIEYDSSVLPTCFHGNLRQIFESKHATKRKELTVIPVSVLPVLGFPLSWIFFRNLGVGYAKICSAVCFESFGFVNIYFHPWEFVELGKYNLPKIFKRNSGKRMQNMLEDYIRWCRNAGARPMTCHGYVKKVL
jgi:hypothetical protein